MRTRIIGDIHGKIYDYQIHCLKQGVRHSNDICPQRSIQVGDFGIGFNSEYWHDSVAEWQRANPNHRFIRGNHDNPEQCKKMPGYIEDGYCENDVMFVGGAWSIDFAYRTPMIDWWPGEEVSHQRFEEIIEQYIQLKPRIMITHDCPTSVAKEMFISKGLSLGGNTQIKTRTGEALQAMWEMHKPEMWFFGHWHQTCDLTLFGTKFQCLGELDFIDVDL